MKRLSSSTMRKLLAIGLRLSRGKKPRPGYLIPLYSKTARNGWHYQIEMVRPFGGDIVVTVFAFRPGDMMARPADYFLSKVTP